MQIHVTDQSGIRHTLDAVEGWRVMEIIREHGLDIKAECGGACACATCHVYVEAEWAAKLHAPIDDEIEMLDGAFHVEDNSRLSCQIIMSEALNGIELILAPGTENEKRAVA
jgi:2Fe-2S ferredoxin